jgi:hypothetical protein
MICLRVYSDKSYHAIFTLLSSASLYTLDFSVSKEGCQVQRTLQKPIYSYMLCSSLLTLITNFKTLP